MPATVQPDPRSLQGTLTADQALSQMQALDAEQQAELQRRTQAAAAQAQQAGQQYQQAAAAPPPQLNPADTFVPTLLSSLASVISQNPDYHRTQQEQVGQQRKDLMQARVQNLQSLRDVYMQQADQAQKLGDQEMELKARTKHEQLAKTIDVLLEQKRADASKDLEKLRQKGDVETENLRGRNRLAEIAASGTEARKTQSEKPKVTSSERAAAVRQGIDPETGLTLAPIANREVSRRLALAKKGDSKSRSEAFSGAMDIATQRWSTDKTPVVMGQRLLQLRHPFYDSTPNQARYAVTGEKVFRKERGKYVKDPQAEARAKLQIKDLVIPNFAPPDTAQAQ